LASLTAIFGSTEENSGGSDKLLELYWNRAELKKEFASLREETFRLQNQVKKEQGKTARLEQKFEQLENLLFDPDWVHNVIVHYQLKAMNATLARKLARFAEQMKQQREKRQHNKLMASWSDQQAAKVAAIETEIAALVTQLEEFEHRLNGERNAYAGKGSLRRYLCRRATTRLLDELVGEIESRRQQLAELEQALARTSRDAAPGVGGLSTASKRTINFMILSFAQEMYLHYRHEDLALLAREAGNKSAGAINYGDRNACAELLSRIARKLDSMPKASAFAEVLPERGRKLAETAQFRSDDDPVPTAESVAGLYELRKHGLVLTGEANLLGDNYWSLMRILSR
jgi:hypothetical protein